jgi:hypothetical protein
MEGSERSGDRGGSLAELPRAGVWRCGLVNTGEDSTGGIKLLSVLQGMVEIEG